MGYILSSRINYVQILVDYKNHCLKYCLHNIFIIYNNTKTRYILLYYAIIGSFTYQLGYGKMPGYQNK